MNKIAICDDKKVVSEYIKEVLQAHDFGVEVEIDTYTSGEELFLNSISKRYDILFMDIELGEESDNGMEISNKIKSIYPGVLIIFFTARVGCYEGELLHFEPFRYIEKPFSDEDLVKACNDAIKRINGWEEKYFSFKIGVLRFQVKVNDIILFSSRRPHITIKCKDEEIEIRDKMDNIENEIKEITDDFIRVSKSYLVNKKYIKKYSAHELTMVNGEQIAITRKYAEKFAEIMKK